MSRLKVVSLGLSSRLGCSLLVLGLCLVGLTGLVRGDDDQGLGPQVPQPLFRYLARPEPKFEWKLERTAETPLGTVHALKLVSQEWHDIVWTHDQIGRAHV